MLELRYPSELPICARREEILAALREHQVLIVAGETGSGKTTQLPKMCWELGLAERGQIGCTQPRRVAAMSVSRRVAEELGVPWGQEVGCKMRFSDQTSRQTRLKFMTDGILLAEIQSDPELRAYSTLIIDEAHERSLNIDFILGYLQGLRLRRPELKILITSATIDTEAFSKAFGGAPIIEVSGRMFPVQTEYWSEDVLIQSHEQSEELGLAELVSRATEEALLLCEQGDVLVFLPTERDIRESREILEGQLGQGIEVLGLYGRMPSGEQMRIFSPGPRRRVILATNVAETSLTIPRIGVVIDSGLARISRYTARTRTKRLPIEPISQSSADQRAGRAGRVQNGHCFRLYAEEDFQKRPRFSQPEIQRANLAEVILRMKAFGLGEVEEFPFLNPPPSAAIRAGYQLLEELGAIKAGTDGYLLTAMGRELAGLPLDPTLGRMLVQARREGVLPEMLVIAAGLSVPDPRERPEEEKESAAAAHRQFAHPESDFLGLLKLWQKIPETAGRANALRKFCKANYLSFMRMKDWREIHQQLEEMMKADRKGLAAGELTPERYAAVHRSILSGLLGQIGQRLERNLYKASADRQINLFPGSELYERRLKRTKVPGAKPEPSRQPAWMVAGEIVQTSQLFARMVAKIDPLWAVELGRHLCEFRYQHPQWSRRAGRVLVWERVLIYGLELSKRQVDHGRINPTEATELFIRGALIEGEAEIGLMFRSHNQKLRESMEAALTRVRSQRVLDLDQAFYSFYAARLANISSIADLQRVVKESSRKDAKFLCAQESDLIESGALEYDRELFPDQVSVANLVLPINYAYTPGGEEDGVTVRVPLSLAEKLETGHLQWMIPGLRQEQIAVLVRGLPKTVRRQLMPLDPKIQEMVREIEPGAESLTESLGLFIGRRYGVKVAAEDWRGLPDHLRPRVEVIDHQNKTLAVGRDLGVVKKAVDEHGGSGEVWERAVREFEKRGLTAWSFGDLPATLGIGKVGGVAVDGYPGLSLRAGGEVDLRLFHKSSEVEQSSPQAVKRLAEYVLSREVTWLQKELKSLGTMAKGSAGTGNGLQGLSLQMRAAGDPGKEFISAKLPETASRHILDHLLKWEPVLPLDRDRFERMIEQARKELPALAYRVKELVGQIARLHQSLVATEKRYPTLEADLRRIVSADFLLQTPHGQLAHLPRYLKAMQLRGERAWLSPGKDAEKAKILQGLQGWETKVSTVNRENFRWMLEEFRVSVFAQELGTAQPVSLQRLNALLGK